MIKVVFEYADELSEWEWRRQECIVSSLEECRRIYGLYHSEPVKWRFVEVEEIVEV